MLIRHSKMMLCDMFTVMCLLSMFGLLSVCVRVGGGRRGWRVLWGGVWRGQSVCGGVWGVWVGDRHVDAWVSLGCACCVGWCARLLLLPRSCVVPVLSYNLDYG